MGACAVRPPDGRGRLLLGWGRSVSSIEGAAEGAASSLAAALDGTRGLDEIVEAIGPENEPLLRDLLKLLGASGVLTDLGADWSRLPAGERGAAAHIASVSDDRLTPGQAREAIDSARVAVVEGDPGLTEIIVSGLRSSGVKTVVCIDDPDAAGTLDEPIDLYLVLARTDADAGLLRWNERALTSSVTWMPVVPYDGIAATVGPIMIPTQTCCYRCVILRRIANSANPNVMSLVQAWHSRAPTAPAVDSIVGGVAVDVATKWIGLRSADLIATTALISLGRMPEVSVARVYRVPRCPACASTSAARRPIQAWHDPPIAEESSGG